MLHFYLDLMSNCICKETGFQLKIHKNVSELQDIHTEHEDSCDFFFRLIQAQTVNELVINKNLNKEIISLNPQKRLLLSQ